MSYILAGFFLSLSINTFLPNYFPLNKISILECHIKIQRNLNVGIRSCFFNVMSCKTCKKGDMFIPLLTEFLIYLLDIERNLENQSYFILRLCVREVFEVSRCFFFLIPMQTFLLKKTELFLMIFPFMVSHIPSHVIALSVIREKFQTYSQRQTFSKLNFNYATKYLSKF